MPTGLDVENSRFSKVPLLVKTLVNVSKSTLVQEFFELCQHDH